MRKLSRLINFRGELFSSTLSSALSALIRLGSSLVLTRLLAPDSYGVVAIMFSIVFMLEMLSEVGTSALIIRNPRGAEPAFAHTVWTVRLIRGIVNFGILYTFAPQIASIYNAPVLADTLRVFSVQFLLGGVESLGFILGQREQRARIGNYVELATSALTTIVVIALAAVLHDHFAVIYGLILQRAVYSLWSHLYYREIGVGFAFDREALADIFKFSRFVLPASMLTIALSQYDKVVLLKLFDLTLLGIYGVAANMLGPVTGLIGKNNRVLLYARCAEYFRIDRSTATARYYSENKRLLSIGVLLPAALAGFAPLLVALLYDARYSAAGYILMAMALAQVVVSCQDASENFLVASGQTHVFLITNIVRVCSMISATLLGYYLFGFVGFLWFGVGAQFAILGYLLWQQRRHDMLRIGDELTRMGSAFAIFLVCWAAGSLVLHLLPAAWIHLSLKRH